MLTLFGGGLSLFSQDIILQDIQLLGGDVVINYSLNDEQVDRKYTLWLYSSSDDFTVPLKEVTGDIGVNLPVGGNKSVTWNAEKELGSDFTGDIGLEIKGQLFVPFVELTGFEDYSSFKRGKTYEVTWTGGRGDNVLNFELYRKGERMHVFPNIANVGEYKLTVPKKIKPGKGYTLKIADARNQDDVVISTSFAIKRKTPAIAKALIFVGVGVAGYFAFQTVTEDTSIPLPPGPN